MKQKKYMSKKKEKKQVAAAEDSEPVDHEIYYHIEHLELNGTFNNCVININAGKPDPDDPPPGGE